MSDKIKVFITVFNRVTWLIPLCEDFVKAGCEVILIDNKSTYPPLLEWYKTCPYKVIYMNKNELAWAFFTTDLYKQYKDRYFIISDSDMDISKVPSDFVNVLFKGFERDLGSAWKVSLSYEIGDLPKNKYTQDVIEYQQRYWDENTLNAAGYYRTWIDLGIALYDRTLRSDTPVKDGPVWYHALSAPRPYTARHMDWYLTEETVRPEDYYYFEHAEYFGMGCLWNERFSQKTIKNLHDYVENKKTE